MRGWRSVVSSGRSSISPNTPTTVSPLLSCTELTSTGTRVPAVGDEVAGRFAGRGGAEHLLSESVAGAGPVLGCYDGGELATANVAEEALGCRIDPADDSGCVDDVGSVRRRPATPAQRRRRLPVRWPSRQDD